MTDQVPTLETLFGTPSQCDCEDCQSVLSPAAYLVDLLDAILKNTVTVQGQTLNGLNVLKEWPKAGGAAGETVPRRGDVLKVELSCPNTTLRIPMIDLITAMLENVISPGVMPVSTDGTEDELAANPQYINEAVYSSGATVPNVSNAFYPWTLPFDLWTAEARQYLGQLGVPRLELLTALRSRVAGEALDDQETNALVNDALVAEALGLTPLERDIVVGAVPSDPEGAFRCWGVSDAQKANWVEVVQTAPGSSTGDKSVNGFLSRSGLSYDQLLDLLPTGFVNPGGATDPKRIDFSSPSTTGVSDASDCDLEHTQLINLTADALGGMHRFVRLQRKLGWTVLELDQSIMALGGGKLDAAMLVRLAHLELLRRRFSLPVDELLSWWTTLDTRGDREGKNALYGRVFQNKTIQSAFSAQAAHFELQEPSRNELTNPDLTKIPDALLPAIAAAVGLTSADLQLLTTHHEISDAFTLKSLSRIYGIASFTRALSLSIGDFLSLRSLLSDSAQTLHIDPFDAARPEQTILFIQEVDRIRQAGFKPFELEYLLKGTPTPLGSLVVNADRLVAVLTTIRDGLRRVDAQVLSSLDPVEQRIQRIVGARIDSTQVDGVMAIAGGTSSQPPAAQTALLQSAFQYLGSTDNAELVKALIPGAAQTTKRYSDALSILLGFERRQQRSDVVREAMKAVFAVDPLTKRLDAGIVEKLWTGGDTGSGAIASVVHTPQSAFSDFMPDDLATKDWEAGLSALANAPNLTGQMIEVVISALIAAGEPAAHFGLILAQCQDFILVRKVAMCLDRCGSVPEDIPWVVKDGLRVHWPGWLDPMKFSGTSPDYGAFRRLLEIYRVRKAFPTGAVWGVIARVDAKVPLATLEQFISDQTRWPVADLDTLAGPGVLALKPEEWADERVLARLLRAMNTVRLLGASVTQALTWKQSPATADQSRAIKSALKAKTGEDGWLSRTKVLQDRLRELRRDALTEFHLGNPGINGLPAFRNVNALNDYFLADTQTAACLTVSLISQSISTVQLLIQRCLMGFERYPVGAADAAVQITKDAATWWAWMGNFQLWVAARKIFLYPGSYLHSALRTNKSPFFRDAENQLMQGELTVDASEQAYRSYLDKVHEVARLEIVGVHNQVAADNTPEVLHIFGRTFSLPHHYYYRTRTQQVDGFEWSAWEKINVDIPGDHLIPIVWNRRLYLFWPVFTEKGKPDPNKDSTSPPLKFFEIQLAFSEYRNGKWSSKRMSAGRPLVSDTAYPPDLEQQFLFKAWVSPQGALTVDCYLWQDDFQGLLGRFTTTCGAALKSDVPEVGYVSAHAIIVAHHVQPATLSFTKPEGSTSINQMFMADSGGSLSLPVSVDSDQEQILGRTPSQNELVYPSVQGDFLFQQPFFFQDAKRTFLVDPVGQVQIPWSIPNKIPPQMFLDPHFAASAIATRAVPPRPPIYAMALNKVPT